MKIIKYSILALVFIWFVTLVGCKDYDEATPSQTEIQLNTLMNGGTNWVLASNGVIKDGFNVTSQFTGFKLNIGNKTYSSENGLNPVWPTSGTWDFQNNDPGLILRDDGVLITVNVSSSNLTLTFNANGVSTGGRNSSVSGEYQFHLISE
ncbi:MAG: hypothetical protein ABJH05_13235 [Fulvivirga sp.]